MSILDIGCGNGKPIAEYLQAKDFDVFGNDISEKLLHHAKNILDSDYVYCSDFRTLTIDKQFDAIICWYMLFHLHEEEHDNALKKCTIY